MSACQMSAQGVSLDSWVDLGMLQTEKTTFAMLYFTRLYFNIKHVKHP